MKKVILSIVISLVSLVSYSQTLIGKINGVELWQYGNVVRLKVENIMTDHNFSLMGDKDELYTKLVELSNNPSTTGQTYIGKANLWGEDNGNHLSVYMKHYGNQFYLSVDEGGSELVRGVYITPKKLNKIFGKK
jgi:hypothetical protein